MNEKKSFLHLRFFRGGKEFSNFKDDNEDQENNENSKKAKYMFILNPEATEGAPKMTITQCYWPKVYCPGPFFLYDIRGRVECLPFPPEIFNQQDDDDDDEQQQEQQENTDKTKKRKKTAVAAKAPKKKKKAGPVVLRGGEPVEKNGLTNTEQFLLKHRDLLLPMFEYMDRERIEIMTDEQVEKLKHQLQTHPLRLCFFGNAYGHEMSFKNYCAYMRETRGADFTVGPIERICVEDVKTAIDKEIKNGSTCIFTNKLIMLCKMTAHKSEFMEALAMLENDIGYISLTDNGTVVTLRRFREYEERLINALRNIRARAPEPSTIEDIEKWHTSTENLSDEQKKSFAERTAVKRWGQPIDMVGPALLLATEAGAFLFRIAVL